MYKIENRLTHQCVKGAKIKIRQFNFELTLNGLISNGNDLSQCSIVRFGDLWVNKLSVSFCNNWTLKTKNKT